MYSGGACSLAEDIDRCDRSQSVLYLAQAPHDQTVHHLPAPDSWSYGREAERLRQIARSGPA